MRRLALQLLILVVIWTMTPGLTEAAENLWHLAATGHTAHAADAGPGHEPRGAEHGCSGTFHLCSCHTSPPTLLPRVRSTAPPTACEPTSDRAPLDLRDPAPPEFFRPPQS